MCHVPHNRRTIRFLCFNIWYVILSFLLLLKIYTFSKEFQITCKYCVRGYLYQIISTAWLLFCFCFSVLNFFIFILFCSLAVWTNSMLWSTTTQTLMSTWWRTWAAWTGWVSLFLGPTCFSFTEGKNKKKVALRLSLQQFLQQKTHLCFPETETQRQSSVWSFLVARTLFCFHSLCVGLWPSPFTALLPLHCTVILLKIQSCAWVETAHCSHWAFLLALVTKLIRA